MAEWWNTSYFFRRGIAIKPDALVPILAGYPIFVTIEHPVYVASNKLRPDFEDIAIVYQPAIEAATPVQVQVPHKLVYDQDSPYLQIVFNAVEDIDEAVNTDYWLYFNNSSFTNVGDPGEFQESDYVISVSPQSLNYSLTFSRPNEDWIDGVSTVTNARAALSFYGVNARLKIKKGPDRGIAEIRVDNEPPVLVDTWSINETSEIVYTTSGLGVDRHYVRLRVTGEKHPSSSGNMIEIEAYEYSSYVQGVLQEEEIYSTAGALQTIVGP